MKRADRRRKGKSSLELLEEAVHLLRRVPLATLTVYYLGALPFVLGLLYFWVDLSRSPFADEHLAGEALGAAALFLWMKSFQALFARALSASLAGTPAPPITVRRCRRIFTSQAALQPTSLFLLPLALLPAALPFPWVFAFYQNATVLADGESHELGSLVNKSRRQAVLWPGQNHILLAVLFGFGVYVFLNWCTVCFLVPQLAKTLFGLDSVFTRSPLALLNSTFFAAMFGLTFLCVDPLVKAVYALRCFYGDSLQSGEDLKAELRPFAAPAAALAVCLLTLIAGVTVATGATARLAATAAEPIASGSGSSAPSGQPPTFKGVSPPVLDRAIQQVIEQNKYTWRMPRERIIRPETQEGLIGRFLDRVARWLKDCAKAFVEWLGEWLRRLFSRQMPSPAASSGFAWALWLHVLLYLLVGAVLTALGILVYRILKNRRRREEPIAAQPIQPAPDLTDENVGPDQLPEDGWTRLARELWERGELRLAMRAFYLASLAHLAARSLISLARFKSNRDYETELRRRGHSLPELLALFCENVMVFDRTWYGLHEINNELVGRFASNVERMKPGGAE